MPRPAKAALPPLEDILDQPLHPQDAEDAALDRDLRFSGEEALDSYDPYAVTSRQPREATSRENIARPGTRRNSDLLPDPPRKPGVTYRWVAVSVMGSQTEATVNASRRYRQGWRPVDTSTLPESYLDQLGYIRLQPGDRIEIGGLILCEMNLADAREIAAELEDKNRRFLRREAEDRRAYKSLENASMPTFDEREFILRNRPE